MTDVDDAIAEVWKVAMGTAPATPQFARRVEAAVTAEITRLRNVIVTQQAQMDQFMARIQHALKELEADDE